MGDIADWILEQAWDEYYGMYGEPGHDPNYDDPTYVDQMDLFPIPRENKTCWWCKTSGLSWKEYEHGWRLKNPDGTIHTCKEYYIKNKKSPP